MSQKRYRPEEIIAKLRQADVLLGEGKKVPEVVKALAIHEVTYYRWRKEYGGLQVSQAKRLKELDALATEGGCAVCHAPDTQRIGPTSGEIAG